MTTILARKRPFYTTSLGAAYVGDARKLLAELPSESVNLIVTSPPYALHFKKEYGNVEKHEYLSWFLEFAQEFRRVLTPDGSLVVDIGGSYKKGQPTRSLYHFRLLIALCDELGFHLAQEFFWYNPAKLPAPAEWVTVRKIRTRDSVECLWWLSKSPFPKADNRKVLRPYSRDMLRLMKRGYKSKRRPSGHNITDNFGKDLGGSIPPNLLEFGNNDSNGYYLRECKRAGMKPHPARFPPQLPSFFIDFLTDEGDLVVDPFAGSNTTGAVAERARRRWLAFESRKEYLEASKFRFDALGGHFEDPGEEGDRKDRPRDRQMVLFEPIKNNKSKSRSGS
jgi:site-specific DNA-methyltransferase (cytosine-N4-specific)